MLLMLGRIEEKKIEPISSFSDHEMEENGSRTD
jgi:hypothetical protein